MLKIAALIWIMLGAALAGSAVMIVLNMPSLAAQEMKAIPYAALAGFIVAIPLAYLIARQIGRTALR